MPLGGLTPARSKSSAYFSGHSTASMQLLLDLVQPADVVPADVGHLDEHLADRRRLDLAQGARGSRPCATSSCGQLLVGDAARGRSRSPAGAAAGRSWPPRGRAPPGRRPTKPCVIVGQVRRGRHPAPAACRGCGSPGSPARPLRSGIGIAISRSKRPGRRSAGSSALGRLVAAMTITCCALARPSISASSCATTRFSTSPTTCSRLRRDGVDLVEEDDARRLAAPPPRRSCADALRSRRRTCG